MSIRSVWTKALGIVTNTGTKAITGVVKDVSGTAKDVVDIRKGLVETKVAQIKVEEHESQIQKATLEDVKKFDPKTKALIIGIGGIGPIGSSYDMSGQDLDWLTSVFGVKRIIIHPLTRRRLGVIRFFNSVACDNRNRILAKYSYLTNVTRDRNGRFIARGNKLEEIIRSNAKR